MPNGTRQENTKREQDRGLDRELEDTFPASDPPNITRVPYERRFTSEGPPKRRRPLNQCSEAEELDAIKPPIKAKNVTVKNEWLVSESQVWPNGSALRNSGHLGENLAAQAMTDLAETCRAYRTRDFNDGSQRLSRSPRVGSSGRRVHR